MDDPVEITDEELDRLIAEVSGGCDVIEGEDFDIMSEFDELNNTSKLSAVESTKNVTAKLKDEATVEVKMSKEGEEKFVKEEHETALVAKKEDENVVKETKETVEALAKGVDEPTAAFKKKENETAVKEVVALTTEISDKTAVKSAAEEGNVASNVKSPKQEGKFIATEASVEMGKINNDDLSEKVADDKKKEEVKNKLTEKTSDQSDKSSPVGPSAGKGPSVKGTKSSQSKGGSSSTDNRKSSPGHMVAESGKKNKATPGKNESAHGGKKLEAGDKRKSEKEKSQTGEERTDETRAAASSSVSGGASDVAATTPSVKDLKIGDQAVVGSETSDAVASLPTPVQRAEDVGEKEKAKSPPNTGESTSEKAGKTFASSPPATLSAGALGTALEEKSKGKVVEEKENVGGDISNDGKSKYNQSKNKDSWGDIGSLGSSLDEVGGSLLHDLETVESNLVEPENKDSIKGNLQQELEEAMAKKEKLGEGETVDDVILLQPLSATEKKSAPGSEGDGGRTPVRADGAKEESRSKEQVSSAAVDSRDGKTEDARVEEEPSDQMKNLKKKLNLSKGQHKDSSTQGQSWFSGWRLSTITGAVQQTGKKVVSTGMDVLGNIGRKTMSVLTDESNDITTSPPPLSSSSPSWSVRFKRKTKSDTSDTRMNERSKAQMLKKCFDDCQGMAHFDALTDLSQVSREKLEKRFESISGDHLSAVKTDLALIEDASDLGGMDWEEDCGNSDHDFHQLIKDFVSQLGLSTNVQKLYSVQETTSKWLSSCLEENPKCKKYSAEDIHNMAILMFADFTAAGIAQFHKIAQLLLVDYSAPTASYKFRSLSLAGLTKVLCIEILIEARRFTECLNQPELMEPQDVIVSLITDMTLEASNCISCLQDGYHLLLPIVQLAALKVHPLVSDSSEISNLEVLRLMSDMSQSKFSKILNQLSPDAKQQIETELSAIEAAFDLSLLSRENVSDKLDHDFGPLVLECLREIGVNVNSQKLLQAQEQTCNWLQSCETSRDNSTSISPSDINQMALKSLNELTFCSLELFHQIGQVFLAESSQEISTYGTRACAVKGLAKVLCNEVGCQSTKFTNCILRISRSNEERSEKKLQIQESSAESEPSYIANITQEASNSTTKIQDGFRLLLPIIRLALFKAHPACAGLMSD